MGKLTRIQDDYYKWWVDDGGGENLGWYAMAAGAGEPPERTINQ